MLGRGERLEDVLELGTIIVIDRHGNMLYPDCIPLSADDMAIRIVAEFMEAISQYEESGGAKC